MPDAREQCCAARSVQVPPIVASVFWAIRKSEDMTATKPSPAERRHQFLDTLASLIARYHIDQSHAANQPAASATNHQRGNTTRHTTHRDRKRSDASTKNSRPDSETN